MTPTGRYVKYRYRKGYKRRKRKYHPPRAKKTGNQPGNPDGDNKQKETSPEELGNSAAERTSSPQPGCSNMIFIKVPKMEPLDAEEEIDVRGVFFKASSMQPGCSNMQFPKVEPFDAEENTVVSSEFSHCNTTMPGAEFHAEENNRRLIAEYLSEERDNDTTGSCTTVEEVGQALSEHSNASPIAHALTNTTLGIRRTTNINGASIPLPKSISAKMDWPNELILRFIRLYESEPVIWNPAHPLHRDKAEVLDAWKRIRNSMECRVALNDLKRKKDSLMATYRVLNREMKNREEQGVESGVVVRQPSWFAYSAMDKFLSTVYKPRIQANSEMSASEMTNDSSTIHEKDEASDKGIKVFIESPECNFSEESKNLHKPFNQQIDEENGSISMDSMRRRVHEAYKIVKEMRQKRHKDDCELYGELLVKKLRRLDQRTRDVVMNDIDNLIFRATLNI